jgi:predicted DNA-binding mobile mystery protein A
MGLGLEDLIGPPPPEGWVRTIRQALGMSSYEMALRTGMSPTRMREFEKGEVDGSIRLAVLGRLARALNCSLLYALVPDEPLELTVWRQARRKASEEIGAQLLGRTEARRHDAELVGDEGATGRFDPPAHRQARAVEIDERRRRD